MASLNPWRRLRAAWRYHLQTQRDIIEASHTAASVQQVALEELRSALSVQQASLEELRSVPSVQQASLEELRSALSLQQASLEELRSVPSVQQASLVELRSSLSVQQASLEELRTTCNRLGRELSVTGQLTQVLLRQQYRDLADRGGPLPRLADVEFRCNSQNGADGILLYIFSLIGVTNCKVLEICAGDGIECNAANLILNHSFRGLLFDGNAERIERGRAFYAAHPNSCISPPRLVADWITAESINDQVAAHGFAGDIDLLSLDLDGNDYWIWKALTVVRPRVVVLEFNASCGPEVAATMSYKPDYRLDHTKTPYRSGASLSAFIKLGRAKGYRLIGVEQLCFNAFFVREVIGAHLLPEVTAAQLYAWSGSFDWGAASDAIMSGPEPWELV
jgi:hypothetical protein